MTYLGIFLKKKQKYVLGFCKMAWQIMTTIKVSSKAILRNIFVSVELKDEWDSIHFTAKRPGA